MVGREDLASLKEILWKRQVKECEACKRYTVAARAYNLNLPEFNCRFCEILIMNIEEITK